MKNSCAGPKWIAIAGWTINFFTWQSAVKAPFCQYRNLNMDKFTLLLDKGYDNFAANLVTVRLFFIQ